MEYLPSRASMTDQQKLRASNFHDMRWPITQIDYYKFRHQGFMCFS
jgi:hypothetical protein